MDIFVAKNVLTPNLGHWRFLLKTSIRVIIWIIDQRIQRKVAMDFVFYKKRVLGWNVCINSWPMPGLLPGGPVKK